MSKSFWLALISVVTTGAAIIWFWMNFDRVSYSYRTPMSGEALRNDFLAVQRLAQRMGASVNDLKSSVSFATLPMRSTLILAASRDTLTERDRTRIILWVNNGGHLVVEAEGLRSRDLLLDALKVSRSPPQASRADERVPQRSAFPTYPLPGRDQPSRVTLLPVPAVNHRDATLRIGHGSDAVAVHFHLGAGQVTAVSSLDFARNPLIGDADNADFFWALTQLAGKRDAIALFRGAERLSLLRALTEHALPALIGLFALLALWLWRITPRFGPLAADPAPVRQSLLEHLRACGRFAWSTGQRSHLVKVAHETALRQIVWRYPDFAALDAHYRVSWLTKIFGLSASDAQLLLQSPVPATQGEFVRLLGLFQWIHERLSPVPIAHTTRARSDDGK